MHFRFGTIGKNILNGNQFPRPTVENPVESVKNSHSVALRFFGENLFFYRLFTEDIRRLYTLYI